MDEHARNGDPHATAIGLKSATVLNQANKTGKTIAFVIQIKDLFPLSWEPFLKAARKTAVHGAVICGLEAMT
ncbi:hypothetical protein BN77_p270018 [Rhizobium mesoamericanum STM3625]|uniref:Uncharacterized protein n=1 Tax=Rhizobium mesoamericanum STM3625 TaxID=1211777 RepID=K0Q502_9HYPH|nr:hypothetical protein BN77_p270018 [Rhizobium mesoamericanum STM3625]